MIIHALKLFHLPLKAAEMLLGSGGGRNPFSGAASCLVIFSYHRTYGSVFKNKIKQKNPLEVNYRHCYRYSWQSVENR